MIPVKKNETLGTCHMSCIINDKKHSKCLGMHEVGISYEAGNYIEHSMNTTEDVTMTDASIFSRPICLGPLSFHNSVPSSC